MASLFKKFKVAGATFYKMRGCMVTIHETSTGRFIVGSTNLPSFPMAVHAAIKLHDRELRKADKLVKRYKLLGAE